MQPVCIPNKPLLGSCLSERVRCTGIKMADDEYDKLKDAHDAIADGDHPVEFAEAFTNWTAYYLVHEGPAEGNGPRVTSQRGERVMERRNCCSNSPNPFCLSDMSSAFVKSTYNFDPRRMPSQPVGFQSACAIIGMITGSRIPFRLQIVHAYSASARQLGLFL